MAAVLRKWKRETEEHGNGPSQPSPKRVRDSSPVAPSAGNDQLIDDELVFSQEKCDKYWEEVKATFKDDEESYQKFLELMRDVLRQGEEVDFAGVVSRITELFRGHTRLILGFNMFLPEDHRTTLPSTEPPDVLMKQQGIMLKRKVEALGECKYKEFCEILALYKKHSNSIDYVYKLAETLFADHNDILADFRTFLPTLEGSNDSEMPAQEPDQRPALAPRKVKFVHLGANVRENEALRKSSGRAEIARKGKERTETTNSKEVAGKLKVSTSNGEEEARTKPTEVHQPLRMSARNATRRQQVQTAPRNAAAAGSPRPASDQRVSARTAARRQLPLPSEDTNTRRAPPPPLPSTAELQERLKSISKCRPDCKACEHVEYPLFDWQAEDPEYYEKGKANREKERQALIARGVPGSFNDSESLEIKQLK